MKDCYLRDGGKLKKLGLKKLDRSLWQNLMMKKFEI
jgi:hypothetical protein